MAGAAAVFTHRQRLALLAGFALLVVLRLPHAWAQGRFLDEEGTIFFAYAWHRPAADALWRSFGGYLNLGANAATLLAARLVRAGLLPLERAPYLTMGIALAFQLLPAGLLLVARGRWLASRPAVIGALLILAISPMTEEVFANVLHIQFHLALCAGLILALDVPRGRLAQVACWALLFLAPLCGPGAIVLVPFFVLRVLVEREGARLAQAAALIAGAALQMLAFFTPNPIRGHFIDPATIASIMTVRLMMMPFLFAPKANKLGVLLHASYADGGVGWWIAAIAAPLYFVILALWALRDRRDPAIWLIVPGLAIAAASFGGGMIDSDAREYFSVGAGERYNFLPLVMISLALIVLARRRDGLYRYVCTALCLLTLAAGAKTYRRPVDELATGPQWRGEVTAWRRDHDRPLAGWPADWSIDLSDRDRPCNAPRPGAISSADPSYCDSAWLARVTAAVKRDKARPRER